MLALRRRVKTLLKDEKSFEFEKNNSRKDSKTAEKLEKTLNEVFHDVSCQFREILEDSAQFCCRYVTDRNQK